MAYTYVGVGENNFQANNNPKFLFKQSCLDNLINKMEGVEVLLKSMI